jgi:hypothetical protein
VIDQPVNGRWGDLLKCDENGVVNIYDTAFKQILTYDNGNWNVQSYNGVMYHCSFNGGIVIDGNFTGYDLTSVDAWNMYGAVGNCTKVYGINPQNGIIAKGQTIRDIIIEDTYNRDIIRRGDSDTYLINPIFNWDDLTIHWHFGTGEVYRQYSFSLEVKNSTGYPLENATCVLKKADLTTIFSVNTSSNGILTEQIVTRGHYNETNGNTLYDYGPFHLTVTHPTYGTADLYNITLDTPVDWEITIPESEEPGETEYLIIPSLTLALTLGLLGYYVFTKS